MMWLARFADQGTSVFMRRRFHRMKEFRKMFVRQVVDRQNSLGLHEWWQHILGVENIRLYSGKQARQNGTNPDDGIFGDRNKVKGRTANTFLA